MPYDSAATRARLMDAAFHEFAERGLAGARVDRIAAAAQANKQAIYAYFGSKDELFDAMLSDRLGMLFESVPFTADDLPGYAGALFDALHATPELMRLTRWRALERDDSLPGGVESHLTKARELRASMGLSDDATAIDVLEITIAISGAWTDIVPELKAVGDEDIAKRQRAHRAVVVAAVAALVDSLTSRTADN
ncbi:TetR family transcriptional regulator [Plantactinospora soyae]|uniref:AcrR family transcriptional regulator n=1 Tax=Plantactinospora soyae TaxID=1544732 RepID=A0A927R858_9ACTN|nr:TetR family transcriptional regulator [Plantactinospora soyae]MBE1490124.1 AcrR family transcriptional regulator [Plantactinospora soyae]